MTGVVFFVAGILSITVSITAITTNSLLLIVIIKNPLHCLRKPSSGLLVALAVADFLQGVIACRNLAHDALEAYITGTYQIPGLRSYQFLLGVFTFTFEIMVVIALTMERLVAIYFPIFHRIRINFKTSIIITIALIVYSVLFTFIQFTSITPMAYDMADILLHHLLPLVTVPLVYAIIQRRLTKQNIAFKTNEKSEFRRQHAERRLASTVRIIALLMLSTLTPYFVIIVLMSYCGSCDYSLLIKSYLVSLVMFQSNSLIHPFVYGWRLRQYRNSFRAVFATRWLRGSGRIDVRMNSISAMKIDSLTNQCPDRLTNQGPDRWTNQIPNSLTNQSLNSLTNQGPDGLTNQSPEPE
ncbi:melanocortin receptor 3 [Nematostella vectensis]|uniref:melanocortin receptor 3 n=1 Tax=Nematostella vectensis TaxID=45351 RepID=UPI0020772FCC|nr:melanocortin receptor 3 [Nematostella vectensis]